VTPPELSRTVRTDTLGDVPHAMSVVADQAERTALASRFGLQVIDRLEAEVEVARSNQDVIATGTFCAEVTQSCVVTGEAVPAVVEESFAVRFRPEPAEGSEVEVELGEDELDVMFMAGALIDVGEAVAQTLALALNPYPRSPEAAAALKEAGVKNEAEAGPFGGLAALKDKLGGA